MAVFLSPVGGAGAQFCDNNGNPLSGGKLYTYSAGTTTPAATYTSAAGSGFHPNPIVLNAGGRVPDSGEIWLTDNISYKFVLKTSADVLIATWDNINGINDIFVSADDVAYDPEFVGSVATTVAAKLQQTVSVKDFGAVGDGVTDDTVAILNAFAYIASLGGGVLQFSNNNSVYLISYGFRIPSNCVVKLNGCTLKATTTFGQGTIPAEGTSAFFTFARPTSESPLASDIGNSTIIGDGAIFEMRRNEQTGTPVGYTGIVVKTTDTPAQVDELKLKNISVSDVTINYSGYDGVYVQGVQNALFSNVVVNHSLRIGFTGISGDSVTFNNCQARYGIGNNPNVPSSNRGPVNSGDGFWNEPNYTWQSITKWQYNNCLSEYNYQSGFKAWNSGADAIYGIELNDCYSYSNVYDATVPTLRSSPGFSQYEIKINDTSSQECYVSFNNCVADTGMDSGFIISKGTGAGTNVRIVLNSCVVTNCNLSNTLSVNKAPISVLTATGLPSIIVNNPTIIAPAGNSLGYGIWFAETTNVIVTDPSFVGNFTYKMPKYQWYGAKVLSSSANISASSNETGTVTVVGARIGDFVLVSSTTVLNSGLFITAVVSASDIVTYYIRNMTSGTVTRDITNLYFQVIPNYGS